MDPLGFVIEDDEPLGCDIGTATDRVSQHRSMTAGQVVKNRVVIRDLGWFRLAMRALRMVDARCQERFKSGR